MNLSRSFRIYEESLRHMPRNGRAATQAALLYQLLYIIRPTGLNPFLYEVLYNQWRRERQTLRNHAVNRMRRAATSRRTHAMREQLIGRPVREGPRTVNSVPREIRNMIASHMRRNRN